MKQILDSFDKAASVTARRLTADIRRTAVRKGWDKEVADNLAVKYDGGKFDVDIPEYYREAALKLEYGTETIRPSSVIRKFKYNNYDSKSFLSTLSEVGKKK